MRSWAARASSARVVLYVRCELGNQHRQLAAAARGPAGEGAPGSRRARLRLVEEVLRRPCAGRQAVRLPSDVSLCPLGREWHAASPGAEPVPAVAPSGTSTPRRDGSARRGRTGRRAGACSDLYRARAPRRANARRRFNFLLILRGGRRTRRCRPCRGRSSRPAELRAPAAAPDRSCWIGKHRAATHGRGAKRRRDSTPSVLSTMLARWARSSSSIPISCCRQDGCAGERGHSAVGDADAVLVAADHRRQPLPRPAAEQPMGASAARMPRTLRRARPRTACRASARRGRGRSSPHLRALRVRWQRRRTRAGAGRQVHLAEQDRVPRRRPRIGAGRTAGRADPAARPSASPSARQERHRVDAETGQPLFQPVADLLRHLVADLGLATLRSGWRE